MIYDKRKGSLLNYIQLPLHVITPYGTYLGVGYDEQNLPKYILSHVKVKCYSPTELVFSSLSKDAIINDVIPTNIIKPNNIVGYNYKITNTELKYGYITVANQRVDITKGKISTPAAKLILEKQLRSIGNVIEKFVTQPLGQPQFDALLHYFYYEGSDTIEDSPIIKLINLGRWYDITDEIQTGIKMQNGKPNDRLAMIKIRTAKMWSYVPGFS